MSLLAFALAAAAVASAPQARSFWKLEEAPRPQPVQTRVSAELVGEGDHLLVYREKGYRFSTLGGSDEANQLAGAVATFDERIFPRLDSLFGPCPDVDGNGKVILLLARSTRDEVPFLPFDLLPEERALAYGLHSNEGEILYLSFSRQGNMAAGNLASLASAFHRLLHFTHDAGEGPWAELLGAHAAVLCGIDDERRAWGDAGHLRPPASPADAWTPHGWPLLLLEYLRRQLGETALAELVARRETGLDGLAAMLAARTPPLALDDLLADFAMACWLDDEGVGGGRLAFSGMTPPRPPVVARAAASRPTSSQISCGAGGVVYLMIEGDGEHPLPLALRGDPRVRWLGRAVHLRQRGPDEEVPLRFDDGGLARIGLPLLPTGDAVLIAAMAVPAAAADFDTRSLTLLWGLGWVPREIAETAASQLAELTGRLPEAGAAVGRVAASLDRLGGLAEFSPGLALKTRYAWSPEAAAAVDAVAREAADRGLSSRPMVFLRSAPNEIRQDWENLLVELPGDDLRRWPVVLAAHWDAARGSLLDSYRRALGLDDNAAGVVVALEAARAAAGRPRRAPVVVALLAGGCHGAAGAAALLDHLQGRAAAWIELDGVGRPARPPRELEVRIEIGGERDAVATALAAALRQTGLSPVVSPEVGSPHTGAAMARARGIPAAVLRTRELDPARAERDVPPEVEREQISPELAALLGQALGRALTALAGAAGPPS
jgi:hypothetical protein